MLLLNFSKRFLRTQRFSLNNKAVAAVEKITVIKVLKQFFEPKNVVSFQLHTLYNQSALKILKLRINVFLKKLKLGFGYFFGMKFYKKKKNLKHNKPCVTFFLIFDILFLNTIL